MSKLYVSISLCVLLLFLVVPTLIAKVTPDEAAKLGKELTPFGAIQAENKEGTIPAWEGGITKPPGCYKPRTFHCDPFAQDEPLFTITQKKGDEHHVDKHKEKLTPGQVAMFKRYPSTWRMKIYPTKRSASYPKWVYHRAIENATRAKLGDEGNGIVNAVGGVPFPIPGNGLEAIWNHVFKYKGETLDQRVGQVAPTASGKYTFVQLEQRMLSLYHKPDATPEILKKNKLLLFLQRITTPARVAGNILLVHEPINQVKESRQAWSYNPGQRRVRRAPHVGYDVPGTASDNQRTTDQNDMWNGAPDRYDWTLVGRRELYVPYNSYRVHDGALKYDDIIKPGHIDPDLLRYELHRVWVVEANLKNGVSHIYSRRTFYIDEDSWQILAVDQYDTNGNIWRVSEAHVINYYEVPILFPTLEAHYDLQNGRYVVFGLNNQGRPEIFNKAMKESNFSPEALRRLGRR